MNRAGTVTLRDYVAVLKQQWWIILGCAAIFAGVAYYLSSKEEDTYQAAARLVVHDLSQSYARALRNATTGQVDINTSTIRLTSEARTGAEAARRANAFAEVAVTSAA